MFASMLSIFGQEVGKGGIEDFHLPIVIQSGNLRRTSLCLSHSGLRETYPVAAFQLQCESFDDIHVRFLVSLTHLPLSAPIARCCSAVLGLLDHQCRLVPYSRYKGFFVLHVVRRSHVSLFLMRFDKVGRVCKFRKPITGPGSGVGRGLRLSGTTSGPSLRPTS